MVMEEVIESEDTVYSALEDDKMDFGRRLLLDNFNDSECLFEFRFVKNE
jgi:hypothetical protein